LAGRLPGLTLGLVGGQKFHQEVSMPVIKYTPESKANAVIRHLQDAVPVSQICQELGVKPTLYYRWQKDFLSSAVSFFQHGTDKAQRQHDSRIFELQGKLSQTDDVISELMEAYARVKKKMGRTRRTLAAIRGSGRRG